MIELGLVGKCAAIDGLFLELPDWFGMICLKLTPQKVDISQLNPEKSE